MRKFLTKLGVFAAPWILLMILAEVLLRSIPNDYSYKRSFLDGHAREIETLIVGSSHAYYGINPDYLRGRAFNASYVSQTLDYDYAIIEHYRDSLQNLSTLVVSVSYPSLFSRLERTEESWRKKNYELYYGIREASSIGLSTEIFNNRPNVNLRRLRSYFIEKKTPMTCGARGQGYYSWEAPEKSLTVSGELAAKRHSRESPDSPSASAIFHENLSMLNSLVAWAGSHHIRVIAVTLPTYHTYRDNLNPKKLSMTIDAMAALAHAYPNCEYHNMHDAAGYDSLDFYDADHLNNRGAEKFSTWLNQIIQHPGE